MQYPIRDLDSSHELWQKALGRANAHIYEENAKLVRQIEVVDVDEEVDLKDIDDLFSSSGTGSHMLELDFIPDLEGPIDYLNKYQVPSQYWTWTHRLTGYKLRRFLNVGGKSFETGRLSKYT